MCGGPRGAFDYAEPARRFHALVPGGGPRLDDGRSAQARRFVSLVGALHDRRVKPVAAVDAPLGGLYRGRRHAGEFERTRSMLAEIRSSGYLGGGSDPARRFRPPQRSI